MRIEGTPPLFHVLVKLATYLFALPVALSLVGALGYATLLAGTYRLLFAISGSRRASFVLMLLFAATYSYSYELGVMVRQYGGALGLIFLSFAYLRDGLRLERTRDVAFGALFGGLAAMCASMSACVAGGGLLAFGLLALMRRGGIRFGWPVLLALPCFYVAYLSMAPWPGRWTEGNTEWKKAPDEVVRVIKSAFVRGAMPVDWWAAGFWARTAAGIVRWAVLRQYAFMGIGAATILGFLVRLRAIRRRPSLESFDVLAVVLGWVPLLYIFVDFYWGSYRHMLFVGLPAIVIGAGWAIDGRIDAPWAKWLARAWLPLAAPWFALQAALLYRDLALDVTLPFSETKMLASLLPEDARVVTDTDWRAEGMLLWRPDITMRSGPGFGRHFRYVIHDAAYPYSAPIRPLVIEECKVAPDRVFYVGGAVEARCLTNLGHPEVRISERAPSTYHYTPTEEQFDLSQVDCACLGVQ